MSALQPGQCAPPLFGAARGHKKLWYGNGMISFVHTDDGSSLGASYCAESWHKYSGNEISSPAFGGGILGTGSFETVLSDTLQRHFQETFLATQSANFGTLLSSTRVKRSLEEKLPSSEPIPE